jgi:hypothetical protein
MLWLLLPLVAGWGLWRRNRGAALISAWWALLLLGTNPQWLSLPGIGLIGNFTLAIAAYFPAAILIGAALGWMIHDLDNRRNYKGVARPAWFGAALFLLAAGAGLWGARQRLGDLQVAQSALATRPDVQAASWIRENTPQNAGFLVNSFFAFGDTLIAGSDGGWWLPLLAQRQTSLPPIIYGQEEGPIPDYWQWVNALPAAILRPLLDASQLLASPYYTPLYHQDRVWIFHLESTR